MKIIKRDIDRLRGVELILSLIFYETQKRTKHDIRIGYLGGKRSAKEQNLLYKDKKSTKDGYIRIGKHQEGIAIDFVIYRSGKVTWYPDRYEDVWFTFLAVSKEFGVKLRWGGDWNRNGIRVDKDKNEKFLDAGHIELI